MVGKHKLILTIYSYQQGTVALGLKNAKLN